MTSADKRSQLRIAHPLRIDIELGAQRHAATSRNLSLGGTFLETAVALREGTRVRLRFSLPTQPDPIVTDAQVRWTERGGAGVCFGGLRAREMWALTRYLGATLAATRHTPLPRTPLPRSATR